MISITFLLIPIFSFIAESFMHFHPVNRNIELHGSSIKYLESNSWQIKQSGVNFLIDPVMSQLDFGFPIFYAGNKKIIDGDQELKQLAKSTELILISQGLDDHAHKPTLKKLSQLNPNIPYVCPPSAKSILIECGINEGKINTISPKEKFVFRKGSSGNLIITATTGAVVGPPWQNPENGYLIRSNDISIYYEPHCMFDESELQGLKADVVISPVVSQELPYYTLVAGGEKALKLAEILKAKYLIPMANGELEQKGLLVDLLQTKGSEDDFQNLLTKKRSNIKMLSAPAGKTLQI